MKMTVKMVISLEPDTMQVFANGDKDFEFKVHLETGEVTGIEDGDFCVKTSDRCSVMLLQAGRIVGKREADYVPYGFGIGGGDYIEMEVKDSAIVGWNEPSLTYEDFEDDYSWEWFPQ